MALGGFGEQLGNEGINTAEDVAGADAGAAARTALPGAQDAHDDATIAFEVLVSVVRDATGWSHDDESPKERLFGAKAAKPGSWWSDESPKERGLGAKAAKPGSWWSDESPKERGLGAKAAKPGSWWSDESPKERPFGRRAAKPGPGWGDDEAPEESHLEEKAAVVAICVAIAGTLVGAEPAD